MKPFQLPILPFLICLFFLVYSGLVYSGDTPSPNNSISDEHTPMPPPDSPISHHEEIVTQEGMSLNSSKPDVYCEMPAPDPPNPREMPAPDRPNPREMPAPDRPNPLEMPALDPPNRLKHKVESK